MDRVDFGRLLEQVAAEKTAAQHQLAALQERVNALAKTEEGLQALLALPIEQGAELEVAATEAVGTASRPDQAQPLQEVLGAPSQLSSAPAGMEAAKQVLQSDPSRFWSVRDVAAEEIRRGWAEPQGKKRNAPARIALVRLKERYPDLVDEITTPLLAYRWSAHSSPRQNGPGESHAEEAPL